ncbi:TIM-barrel domain-containing protein [Burkholderia sp. S171]|uniref:glycoside hydrolase family 31 protein n=1 Tax=Burkholderia sp. S171 TaxID=1641860 RepID=UPI00131BF422|nr:TIM-barrel domain-containing protein [Burkholderia sp. S171]
MPIRGHRCSIAVLLASLLFDLSGCGGDQTPTSQTTASSTPIAQAAVDPATATPQSSPSADPTNAVRSQIVLEGQTRFEVLSPTLIRAEYSPIGKFEDNPTFNAVNRAFPVTSFTEQVVNGVLILKTSAMTLSYKQGSGQFTKNNLSIQFDVAGKSALANPEWLSGKPMTQVPIDSVTSGWRESIDVSYLAANGKPPGTVVPGLVSNAGWYLLDDSQSALFAGGHVTQRDTTRQSGYQDGYLFGYGHNYKQALSDFRTLTGPAVMLPRSVFGVWFSRWYAYSFNDYKHSLIPAFRSHHTPLDVLVSDTDWKTPDWNGWEFNSQYFPNPAEFFNWAQSEGLRVALNVHPSMSVSDPKYKSAEATAGESLVSNNCYNNPAPCGRFDLGKYRQLKAFFNLHNSIDALAPVIWWMDWSGGEVSSSLPGISPVTWVNYQYVNYENSRPEQTGLRNFAFSRIGGDGSGYGTFNAPATGPWAEHRYTVNFTGDSISNWETLAFEAKYTPGVGAAIGLPYVTHDLGGFRDSVTSYTGDAVSDDLYARWVQLGTFQPIMRLHSAQGRRLPWEYGAAAEQSAEKFLRLREMLVPYTYTLARNAHDTGIPITEPLYLEYPDEPNAYGGTEYLYGDALLIAPVTTAGSGTVATQVWFPPGNWVNFFTGASYSGSTDQSIQSTLMDMPAFLKAGGIVPMRSNYVDHDVSNPIDQMTLNVAAGADGTFNLYEDSGDGLDYLQGKYATTLIDYKDNGTGNGKTLTIHAQRGTYSGAIDSRAWTIRMLEVSSKPRTVSVDGQQVRESQADNGWSYDETDHILTVQMGTHSTKTRLTAVIQ